MNPLTGGCQCGAVRYCVARNGVRTLYCCHCLECQRQSASAFAMSMKVEADSFELLKGTVGRWQRATDAGGTSVAIFCPSCGCRIHHTLASHQAPWLSLKAGTLDDTQQLKPVGHIWIRRAQPWVRRLLAPDALLFDEQPPSYQPLVDAWQRSGWDCA